ncbi:hypothetical protein Aph01nite_73940 [Acrocarpospora phusangensis]|uniref:Uncharacterized protein n=1 Tax=Acrocarpospora phusangensis TaxID=1070424 RepID=A0A919QHC0_9ACTN|nr:hypothetical protein [Acrocarpospora phusangensis]GIH29084.1 hypothetical protein Aph01nite_73940 [Acrocarpospora phusangensis]
MARRISTVVGEGDRRASLEAIRDKLARELQAAIGKDAATLAKQLRETLAELESLPGGKEVSAVDEIAERRTRRIADAAGQ